MKINNDQTNRRKFIKGSTILTAGLISSPLLSLAHERSNTNTEGLYIIGPKEGYAPQIGTLLSTMTMMRTWLIYSVKDLTVEQLDYQIDDQSNSIGAMLLHLAATEKYYQLNTFEELAWGSWSEEIKKEWDVPMGLGKKGRDQIKGNEIEYYISKLNEVREVTKEEFAQRNDEWLNKSEPFFQEQPTNNYCKWFHVCEHESNHNGQIKFIKKRFPS
ncbi:DinB family protein [uncultured Eudoraea sp.]|uniref:DinB family protein n=1 Tax=uncultured Eudoraea sp. TaxID=1035614 RepID=UPI00260A3F73|nr:DinB family protein [uncultured Eudoraea sp.]